MSKASSSYTGKFSKWIIANRKSSNIKVKHTIHTRREIVNNSSTWNVEYMGFMDFSENHIFCTVLGQTGEMASMRAATHSQSDLSMIFFTKICKPNIFYVSSTAIIEYFSMCRWQLMFTKLMCRDFVHFAFLVYFCSSINEMTRSC